MKTVIFLCVFVLLYSNSSGKETAKKNATQKINQHRQDSSVSTVSTPSSTSRPTFQPTLPCVCRAGQCSCCTGYILDRFNQKACLNITYEPDDFAFTASMSFNGRVLYRNSISGKNPQPICIRVPRLQFIKFCVQFSNIYVQNRNIHICIDMAANWDQITLLEWSFDCIRMGVSGFAVISPEEGGGLPNNPIDVVDQTDEDYDDSARTTDIHIDEYFRNTTNDVLNTIILDPELKTLKDKLADESLIEVISLPSGSHLIKRRKE